MTPSMRSRVAGAAATGFLVAALALWVRLSGRSNFSDFDQLWIAARALLSGRDAYDALRGTVWPGLVYPMPAVIIAIPFAFLPAIYAHALFAGLGMAGASYALSESSWWPCLCLLSFPAMDAIQLGQWSPWFVAATVLPGLGWLAIAKPTTGTAVVCAYGNVPRLAIGFAVALLAVSFVADPLWVAKWLAAVGRTHYFAPLVLRPGGALLLLAGMRWRRPEARLLVALAVVPQTLTTYEAFLLTLVVRTRWEAVFLALAGYAVLPWLTSPVDGPTLPAVISRNAPVLLAFLYLPALVMVLRRPNEGQVQWIAR